MQRSASIDFAKIALAAMVVALHAEIFKETSDYLSFIFVNGFLRIAVPLFFIINGFYFYNIVAKGKPLLPWVKRMATLYAVWMVLYLPFYYPHHPHSIKEDVEFLLKLVIGYHHLWYLAGSLGAGLVLYWVRGWSDAKLLTAAVLLFLLGAAAQYVFNYVDSSHLVLNKLFNNYWLFRNFLLLGFPMYAIGFLIAKGRANALSDSTVLALTVLGVVALFVESSLIYFFHPVRDHFDNCFSLILACPAIFLFVQRRTGTLTTDLYAKVSTVIYFIHPYFIFALMGLVGMHTGTVLFLIAIGLSLLASPLVIALDRRLKLLL